MAGSGACGGIVNYVVTAGRDLKAMKLHSNVCPSDPQGWVCGKVG
jgi:hypothetical protein